LVTSITEWVMTLLLRSGNAAAFTNATIKRCDFLLRAGDRRFVLGLLRFAVLRSQV
jgi:hypothetical protein